MKYSSKDRYINDQFYGYFLHHNQDDGWGDKDKYGNFNLLTEIEGHTNHPIKKTSVLDVGCGTGDLYEYLYQKGVRDYVGIDIYHMSVEYAQMKYPKGTFITGDFLEFIPDRVFDYVFCSGTLAAVLESDNYTVLAAFIKRMWSLSTIGVAFNFLTREYPQDKDDELFLYDFDEVIKIGRMNAPGAKIESTQNRAGDEQDFLQTHIYLLK